jgi:hypothetical protein
MVTQEKLINSAILRYRLGSILVWLGVFAWAPFIFLRAIGVGRSGVSSVSSSGVTRLAARRCSERVRQAAVQEEHIACGWSCHDLAWHSCLGSVFI